MMLFDERSHESCIGLGYDGRRALWGVNAAGSGPQDLRLPLGMKDRSWRRGDGADRNEGSDHCLCALERVAACWV
jgi:hypothetical protein